ncbi:Partial mannosyltransferase B [Klebsiella oxytoca]|nr:Partial mannosyltransferase B [Klebsiella oxytoca]HEO8931529.1 glycosyltransferase family 4 protein [Serratia marcescens]HEP0989373.1 glycosyltransferase family 4 protein [Serratia marcescens]
MIYVNSRFFSQDITGVQRFGIELSGKLHEQRDDIVFLAPKNIRFNDITRRLNVEVIGSRTGHTWEQLDLPAYLRAKGSPLLVNLCNTAPIFYRNKIITLHDAAYKRFPASYSFKFRQAYNILIPRLVVTSRAVLTVSQFAKSELEHFFNLHRVQCHVVYNAASDIFHYENGEERREQCYPEYFLAVASQQYHKNFEGLIEAFTSLPEDMQTKVKLKIVGSRHKNYQGANSILSSVATAKNVEFLGRVDDDALSALYRGAAAFVFPSFYEGFGIPPIEAQASGCPVIASSAGAMPEVLQDSVIYFDPYDRNSLVDALRFVIENPFARENYVAAGYKNIARFSWEKSALRLSDIIDNL